MIMNNNKVNTQENLEGNIGILKVILKGTIISMLVTLIFLLIFSVVLTYTNLSEDIINPGIIVLTAISIIIGASISTIKTKKRGIVNGGIIGIVYMLFLYLISSMVTSNFGLDLYSVIMLVVGIMAGMLGGIVGVNMK